MHDECAKGKTTISWKKETLYFMYVCKKYLYANCDETVTA